MAVYRRRYQAGPERSGLPSRRFLVFTRYDMRALAGTRLFVMFFALSFAAPLVGAVLIYLHFNPLGLKVLEAGIRDLLPINGDFFLRFLVIQTTIGSLLAALVGPGLVAPDLANNALPLYLSRPIRKRDYIAGKLLVLVGMMSVLTWVPIMLMYLLQSVLQGWSWFAANLRHRRRDHELLAAVDPGGVAAHSGNFGVGEAGVRSPRCRCSATSSSPAPSGR